ncbi:hypothetical protein FB451DRAFT_1393860 [Mycena latifolia]|nr:hypothetical protein FB451DRAFT_1393860 [Mycena latifolia]
MPPKSTSTSSSAADRARRAANHAGSAPAADSLATSAQDVLPAITESPPATTEGSVAQTAESPSLSLPPPPSLFLVTLPFSFRPLFPFSPTLGVSYLERESGARMLCASFRSVYPLGCTSLPCICVRVARRLRLIFGAERRFGARADGGSARGRGAPTWHTGRRRGCQSGATCDVAGRGRARWLDARVAMGLWALHVVVCEGRRPETEGLGVRFARDGSGTAAAPSCRLGYSTGCVGEDDVPPRGDVCAGGGRASSLLRQRGQRRVRTEGVGRVRGALALRSTGAEGGQ